MATFAELWDKIKVIFSQAWTVMYPFIKQFLSAEGAMVLAMAPAVVQVLQDTMGDADGSAKRQEAFARIEAALMAQGIKIAASVIYSAIEAAVAGLKATSETKIEAKILVEGLASAPIQTVQP